jgi:hypothetical protein
MQSSIGNNNRTWPREASAAVRRALYHCASVAGTRATVRCWHGQMIGETFSSMIISSRAPMPMAALPPRSAAASGRARVCETLSQ